jgi:hypothetical protein
VHAVTVHAGALDETLLLETGMLLLETVETALGPELLVVVLELEEEPEVGAPIAEQVADVGE